MTQKNEHEKDNPRFYSLSQVKCHDSAEDLWMIIYNKIYDVTTFAKDHPGGVEVLLDCGGVDATEPFEDVAHSDDALRMLTPFYVGEVIAEERKKYPESAKMRIQILENPYFVKEKSKKGKRKKKKSKVALVTTQQFKIFFLIILAVTALALYFTLQRIKWSACLHIY